MIFKRPPPASVIWAAPRAWGVDRLPCPNLGRNPLLSPLDMLVIGVEALLFFGPDQLPGVARKVGSVVRELQMTSQSFIREMERAADDAEAAKVAQNTPLDIEEIPPVEHVDEPVVESADLAEPRSDEVEKPLKD